MKSLRILALSGMCGTLALTAPPVRAQVTVNEQADRLEALKEEL